LEVTEEVRIEDVYVRTHIPEGELSDRCDGKVRAEILLDGIDGANDSMESKSAFADLRIHQSVTDPASGETIAEETVRLTDGRVQPIRRTFPDGTRTYYSIPLDVNSLKIWDASHPNLYVHRTELIRAEGGEEQVIGVSKKRIGFRRAEFRTDGFYLNGRKFKLRGMNRHQSWPYVGYAMPDSQQRLDADILKNELGCNYVRTSHYPQAQSFIDRCDELGILVFTEIPGWQHMGDEDWENVAVNNVAEMVVQYRNHPSIILWGVRINESSDNDRLYTRTNKVAHDLDPDRPTSGVRCIKKSSLLEDVYAYNDFVHDGIEPGCCPKAKVTQDVSKPYIVSEYGGHMFPTKSYDSEDHRLDHALRHATVLDAIAKEEDISGSTAWCMFDYNTHRDFGSGDRICYHGVLDMYRNPKLAAALYASQSDEKIICEISSSMDIGEHPSGNPGKIWIFTNADSVRMYKNGELLHEYLPSESPYRHLNHPPMQINDFVGNQMADENFAKDQEKAVRDILNYAAVNGFNRLPPKILAKSAMLMARYGMKYEDAYALYGKYVGNWGNSSTVYRFEAVKNGEVVKVVTKVPAETIHMECIVDHTDLLEGKSYDVAAIRVMMRDQNEGSLPFYQGAVTMRTEGPIDLIGPKVMTLRGGAGGTYVKTTGAEGNAAVILTDERGREERITFTVKKEQL
ncbi:MAG: glycoside hydrolase family 2 TIM barrel-domain containing protein, partial [Eubacterium sp.]|nr:glycoside hydrolase family 2 TIM barrel-domain containing protein [Eubacterium sp.]